MKKISVCLVALIFSFSIIISKPVSAAETVANVSVSGDIKEGNSIEISVDLENATSLYGGDIKLFYDSNFLKVESITPNRDIISENYMQYNKPLVKNMARFYFTMQGDKAGYSGSGNFVKIKATVLKEGNLNLKDNVKLQLVEKPKGKNPENMKFTMKINGDDVEVKPDDGNTPDDSNNSDNSDNSNDENSTDNSGSDNSSNDDSNGNNDNSSSNNDNNVGTGIGTSVGSGIGNKANKNSNNSSNHKDENNDSNKAIDESNKENIDSTKNDNSNSSEEANENDEKNLVSGNKNSNSKTPESNNYIVYAGVVLVLIGGIGIYVYMKRKKEK